MIKHVVANVLVQKFIKNSVKGTVSSVSARLVIVLRNSDCESSFERLPWQWPRSFLRQKGTLFDFLSADTTDGAFNSLTSTRD